jgi:hypothetical protein
MELTSAETIRALMQGSGNPTPVRVRRGALDAAQPASKDRKMRCRCGLCWGWLENARWERIFAE